MLQIKAFFFNPESPYSNIYQHGTEEEDFLPENYKQHNFNHRPKANTGLDRAVKNSQQRRQMQTRQLEGDTHASGIG